MNRPRHAPYPAYARAKRIAGPEWLIALLAERQHGIVAAWQLYSLGLSDDQVSHRVKAGWLHRMHRGVYSVGHRRIPPAGHWMAAVLAVARPAPGTPTAVLSHRSAAALWTLCAEVA